MDLEKLNNQYLKLKNNLEQSQKDIEILQSRLTQLTKEKEYQKARIIVAKQNGDPSQEKDAQDEIKRIDDEVRTIKEEAEDKLEDIKKLQEKINDRIEQIKQDPEMKKHLEEVMAKKYDRKLSKLEKEKQEVSEKKDRLQNLQKLVTEHPALGYNLKGVLIAQKQITDLKKELESLEDKSKNPVQYKDPARANEIKNKLLPEAQNKLQTNKTSLMSYVTKNNIDVTEQDLNELAEKGYTLDKKGNVDLETTINKSISSYNKQLKGYDKSINDHKIALEKLGRKHISKSQTTGNKRQGEKEEPEEKWYQKLFNKFRNWNEKRKQKKLQEGQETDKKETSESQKSKFRDSMKYDIVKDITEQMEIDGRKDAKKERKENQKSDGR